MVSAHQCEKCSLSVPTLNLKAYIHGAYTRGTCNPQLHQVADGPVKAIGYADEIMLIASGIDRGRHHCITDARGSEKSLHLRDKAGPGIQAEQDRDAKL